MILNAISYGATTIQFRAPPLRDADDIPELVQTSALASDGALYVYNKALHYRIGRRLTYTQVSDATLAALRTLHATVDGGRHLFIWYDHLGQDYYSEDYFSEDYIGGGHSCRFTAPLKHTQTGPNRHRVEIELEELLPLATPFAASWNAATAAVSGSSPCWLFRLTVNGVDYWLSDHVFTVAGWAGRNITTLPLVKAWGSVQSGITGGLAEYKVSDFSVDLLIDPDTYPNLRDLSLWYEFEQYPVELHLWFHGLNAASDPPRLKWRGHVRNHPEMDDTTLRLECEDESARLSKNIGTLLDVRAYPSADPKDVGKVIPIVFGNAPQIPALGADIGRRTTLPAAISASSATFDLSDVSGFGSGIIQVDDEQLQISAITGNTVSVYRGINGTLAAAHSRGAAVWEVKPEFVYIAAEALDALSRVYGAIDDIPIDITGVCSRYTGQPGSEHPSGKYPGLAVVSLPGLLTATQLDSLGVARTGAASKIGGATKSGAAVQAGNIQDYALSDAGHGHVGAQAVDEMLGGLPLHIVNNGSQTSLTAGPGPFAAPYPGAALSVLYEIVIETMGLKYLSIGVPGGNYAKDTSITGSSWYNINGTIYIDGSLTAGGYIAVAATVLASAASYLRITSIKRTITYKVPTSSDATGVNKTAANNGTLNVADTVGVTDTIEVSDTIAAYLTGLSTVRSIISHNILCDCSRNIYLPPAVEQDILTRAGGGALTTIGTFPPGYRFDGAITEYKSAQYWLDYFAFQCRSWFVKDRGIARLIVRPDVLIPIKTISNCLLDGNTRSLKISKAPLSEVINVMALRYDRDWSQSRSAENYKGCLTDRMAESIKYYGEREAGQPEMFWFDFVRDYSMALHVMGYYLGKHSRRHRIYKFNSALDNEALFFSAAVTLGFEGNQQVEITAADLVPGDKSRLDSLAITASDIHTEWPYMAEDYYSEDFSLSNT